MDGPVSCLFRAYFTCIQWTGSNCPSPTICYSTGYVGVAVVCVPCGLGDQRIRRPSITLLRKTVPGCCSGADSTSAPSWSNTINSRVPSFNCAGWYSHLARRSLHRPRCPRRAEHPAGRQAARLHHPPHGPSQPREASLPRPKARRPRASLRAADHGGGVRAGDGASDARGVVWRRCRPDDDADWGGRGDRGEEEGTDSGAGRGWVNATLPSPRP